MFQVLSSESFKTTIYLSDRPKSLAADKSAIF
jgi:hypothetical protein